MNKNNITTIVVIAGIIAVLGGLFYLSAKNKSSSPANTASDTDSHGHNMSANVSSAVLNNLVGKQTPDFSLADRDGNIYSSENLRGKNIILFFNEGLMCYPACWNQIVALAKDDRFKNSDTVVLSVVIDSQEDWQKAIDKMPELARATVVFDRGAAVSNQFSILRAPSSMHPGSFPGHTFVLIDKEGIIRYVFDDPQMGIRNDQLTAEIAKLK